MPHRRLLPPRPCQPAHLLADKPPLDFSLRFFTSIFSTSLFNYWTETSRCQPAQLLADKTPFIYPLILLTKVKIRICVDGNKYLPIENNLREGYWSLDWGVEFVVATYGLLGGVSVAFTMVAPKT